MLLLRTYITVYRPIQHVQMQENLSFSKHEEIEYFVLQMLILLLAGGS